jgi:tRNA nucleotidyltransferase (CCA-adding enzyme)
MSPAERSASALATGEHVLEALQGQPGGPELLELAAERDDLMLVGGALRDLLIGRQPRELDVVVADGAMELATELASRLGVPAEGGYEERSESTFHERFRTALVRWSEGRIDIATRRAESYPSPGALPKVVEGTVEQDLRRRDFTVNAIALALGGPRRGALQAAEHALEDLACRRLRALHDASFVDDPTRLLRLARYRARLGFEIEPHTAGLAREALEGGALNTISRARIGAELRLALSETGALAALEALEDLGVLAAMHAGLQLDVALAERALALLPADGRPGALLMASLLPLRAGSAGEATIEESAIGEAAVEQADMAALLDGLEFTAAERERTIRSALVATSLAAAMGSAERPSQLHVALASESPEAVALAGASAGPGSPAERAARSWLESLRKVRLSIGGEDLLAAGIPAGPEIGRRLAAALAAKLDGSVAGGREAELAVALREPA